MYSANKCYAQVFAAYPLSAHKKIYIMFSFSNKEPTQVKTNVMVRVFNAGLLTKCFQSTSGKFCDRPTRLRSSVVFFGPRAHAQLKRKLYVALLASNAALQMTSKFRPNIELPILDQISL
jgi:hypothetical protein